MHRKRWDLVKQNTVRSSTGKKVAQRSKVARPKLIKRTTTFPCSQQGRLGRSQPINFYWRKIRPTLVSSRQRWNFWIVQLAYGRTGSDIRCLFGGQPDAWLGTSGLYRTDWNINKLQKKASNSPRKVPDATQMVGRSADQPNDRPIDRSTDRPADRPTEQTLIELTIPVVFNLRNRRLLPTRHLLKFELHSLLM